MSSDPSLITVNIRWVQLFRIIPSKNICPPPTKVWNHSNPASDQCGEVIICFLVVQRGDAAKIPKGSEHAFNAVDDPPVPYECGKQDCSNPRWYLYANMKVDFDGFK